MAFFMTKLTMRTAMILGVILLRTAYGYAASPERGVPGSTSVAAGHGNYHLEDKSDHVRITTADRDASDEDRIVVTVEIDRGFHINAKPASFEYLIPTTLNVTNQTPLRVIYPQPVAFKPKFADEVLVGALFPSGYGHGNRVADGHRTAKPQVLANIDRARSRQFGAEHGRDERTAPHAVGDDVMKEGIRRVLLIEVGRVDVARHHREELDIGLAERAREGRAIADRNLIEGPVLDQPYIDRSCFGLRLSCHPALPRLGRSSTSYASVPSRHQLIILRWNSSTDPSCGPRHRSHRSRETERPAIRWAPGICVVPSGPPSQPATACRSSETGSARGRSPSRQRCVQEQTPPLGSSM